MRTVLRLITVALALASIVVAAYFVRRHRSGLPPPGSTAYEETTPFAFNISFLVDESSVTKAVQSLHRTFFP